MALTACVGGLRDPAARAGGIAAVHGHGDRRGGDRATCSSTRSRFDYTILTSANAMAVGFGGLVGGLTADRARLLVAFTTAAVMSALPLLLLPRWTSAADASARDA